MGQKSRNDFELLQKLILESQNNVNSDVSSEIEKIKASIELSENRFNRIDEFSTDVKKDISESLSAIEEANSLISHQGESIAGLSKALKNIDWERSKDNERFTHSLDELLLNLNTKSSELESIASRLNNLKSSLSAEKVELEESLSSLGAEIKNSNEEIETLQSELSEKIKLNQKNLDSFSSLVKDEEYLKGRVDPFVDNKLKQVKENFMDEYGSKLAPAVTQIMEENPDAIIQVLFPMIGKMIKAFVKSEMEKLFESINNRMDSTFSATAIKRRFKSIFTGVSASELAAQEAFSSNIESVYIIHKESGLLIGSYTKEKKMDEDMLAGMLTAIKQFSEEAFNQGQEDLSTIDYGDNKIHIQNFYKYYVAVVLNGIFDAVSKEKLESHLLEFSESHLSRSVNQVDGELYENISKKLKLSIYEFNQIG